MNYQTKPMTPAEIELCKRQIAGALGHSVIGYRDDGTVSAEVNEETQLPTNVVFLRRRMPNGRFIWRKIVTR